VRLAPGRFGRLALRDYHPFVPIVGRAYMARPMLEPAAVPSWRALAAWLEPMFRQVQSRVHVVFTPQDPYQGNIDAMVRDIRQGRLQVWMGGSEHGVFTPEQNWKFRAVHDYMTHFGGEHSFSLRGEMAAYNRHIKTAPRAAWPALFTEVVGQVCTFFYLGGEFGPQKIAYLYGFDYENVGLVDPGAYRRNFTG
jgi:hypothetical protein